MTSAVVTTVDQPQSVDDVCTVMLDAISRDEPLHILGADTWHNAGAPVHATRIVSLAAVSGIVAYVPGDLTITALAGTTLAELAHVTASHGQWIGLDPAGARGGTIGATVATGSSGPLSQAFGTPRDLVLGLDTVTGYGERGYGMTKGSFMLMPVLWKSGLVRASSDLSRVKVTRKQATGKRREWVIDCSGANGTFPDLWLQDGDVIEVPDKL